MYTDNTRKAIAAGFSLDEIRAEARNKYDTYLAAGFSPEEANSDVMSEYGFNFAYDSDLEDENSHILSALDAQSPEDQEKFFIDADTKHYKQLEEQERLEEEAKALESKEEAFKRDYPFDDSYTPEQKLAIEQEQKAMPMFRKYTDTELANQGLYDLRDSVIVSGSKQGALSWRDKMHQDSLVKGGKLKQPEQPKIEPTISTASDATMAYSRAQQPIKQVASPMDAARHGFGQSTTSLAFFAPPRSVMGADAPFSYKVAAMAAQQIGDLPAYVAGGVMGGAATAATGSGALAGAFGGAMAFTESLRASLMMNYTRGGVTSAEEFLHRTAVVGETAATSYALGRFTGHAGGAAAQSSKFILPAFQGRGVNILRAAAQPATEVAAMTAGGAVLEQQLPTAEDLVMGGIAIGGIRLGGFYTNKLAYNFQKHGMTPKSIIQFAKKNLGFKEDLIAPNMKQAKDLGGNYIPLYLVKRNKPMKNEGPDWYRESKHISDTVAGNLNKSNRVTSDRAPSAYQVKNFAISADTKFLEIRGVADPNKVRLYRQFMKKLDPEFKPGKKQDLQNFADLMFEKPSQEFMDFISSGEARIGKKEDIKLSNIGGLKMGDKVLIFDKQNVLSGSVLDTISLPMEVAAADIQSSVSVREASKKSKGQHAKDTYQSVVDRLQPLNQFSDPGMVSVPYMMARNYMGVNGLISHWLEVGRTNFTRPSLRGESGFTRQASGKSLKAILEMGESQRGKEIDPKLVDAAKEINAVMKDNTIADIDASIELIGKLRSTEKNAYEAMGAEAPEYRRTADRRYDEGKAALLEARDVMSKTRDTLDMFRTYLVAKHAVDLHASGINTGISPAAAKTIANNQALRTRYEAAAQELYAFQRSLLKYKRDSGIISHKTYVNTLEQHPNYIPLNRVIDTNTSVASTGGFGIKGSTRTIIDPLESLIRQTYHTIREAERNSVMRLIAEEYGDTAANRNLQGIKTGTLEQFRTRDALMHGASSQQTISYRKGGKEHKVSVPEDIFRAASQLDPVTTGMYNGMVKAAANVASVLRAGAIMHPNFGARNFFRDQFSAYINSDSGYKMFYDFGLGLASIVSRKTGGYLFPEMRHYYNSWLRHGGSNATLIAQDRTYTQKMLGLLLSSNNVHNSMPFTAKAIQGLQHAINPLNWGKKGFEFLQRLSELSEEGTRMGEYMRAMEQGMNPAESAYRSREVTMDFARIGANMKALNSMSVFLNAKIQGADRSIRQIRAHPLRTTNRIMTSVVIPSILLAMVQQDIIHNSPDSDMAQALKEVPDWQKNTFWLVPSPVGLWRVPIPHEYGIPFANPARSFIEHAYDMDKDKNFLTKLYEEDYFGDVAEQYMMDWNTLATSFVPTALLPVMETVANYSFFTGQPVIPATMENQLPESRYNRNTTELSKAISRILSEIDPMLDSNVGQRLISPVAIDHLVQGYTGSLGKDLWELLDTAGQKAGVLPQVEKPAKTLADVPLIGAFLIKYPNSGSQSVNNFFDEVKVLEQTMATIKAYMKEGTATGAQRAEHLMAEKVLLSLSSNRTAINNLSQFIRYTHFNPDLSPEEKREHIDGMYVNMINIARVSLDVIKTAKREHAERKKAQIYAD